MSADPNDEQQAEYERDAQADWADERSAREDRAQFDAHMNIDRDAY